MSCYLLCKYKMALLLLQTKRKIFTLASGMLKDMKSSSSRILFPLSNEKITETVNTVYIRCQDAINMTSCLFNYLTFLHHKQTVFDLPKSQKIGSVLTD